MKVRASVSNYITRDRVGPRQTGKTVLIDRDFFIIADSRSVEGAARNLRYRSEEIRSAFSGIQVSGAFRNYQDIPVLGSAALLGTPNWVIVTEIAVSEVLAPLVGIRNRILIFGGVFLILSLVFAVLIGRSLTRPILGVRDAAARPGAGDLDVCADGGQLTQVFRYLVENAVKFRGARPPQVSISWKQSEDEIEFSVRDRGIGIDEKDFERIFLLFQRLHGWDEYPGRGVGLAISKKIVERHQGRIRVESALGEGASFYFAIPLSEAA